MEDKIVTAARRLANVVNDLDRDLDNGNITGWVGELVDDPDVFAAFATSRARTIDATDECGTAEENRQTNIALGITYGALLGFRIANRLMNR